MYNLTPENTNFLFNSVFALLTMGIVFFAVSTFIIIFLFGFSLRDVAKNKKGLLILLLVALSIPTTVGQIYQKTNSNTYASVNIKVSGMEVVRVSNDSVLVNFTTTEPCYAYIVYRNSNRPEFLPVLPTYTLDKRVQHSILIMQKAGLKGEANIVINGKIYLINGKTVKIEV